MSKRNDTSGCCGGEFKLSNFGLTFNKPHYFVTSQWGRRLDLPYVIWRVCWSIFFLVWLVLTGIHVDRTSSGPANHIKWFIYLTNWAFFLLNVNLLLHAIVTITEYVKQRNTPGGYEGMYTEMPWYYKMMWVIYNMASGVSLTISVTYWSVVHGPEMLLDDINIITHAGNSIYIVIDALFINGIPLRIYHLFHVMLTGLVYLIFTVIYDLSGGTNALDQGYVYSVIDWSESPGISIAYSLGVLLIGISVLWLVLYAVYRLRLLMVTSCTTPATKPDTNHVV